MDYEKLYEDLQPVQKKLKDAAASAQKCYKAVVKDIEAGNIKDLNKIRDSFYAAVEAQNNALNELSQMVDAFDVKEYFESGEFTKQLLDECKEKKVDVYGEAPVYEMFPYKVKIDMENQDLYIDRKKVQCVRPSGFAEQIRAGQEKLNKAPFKAESFAEELAAAYDLAILKTGKKSGTDVLLTNVYKLMVPMSRSRKEYDQQNFAFDIARLFASDVEMIRDGRRFQFGPSRNNKKAIRILDGNGQEQFLATVSFL